MTPFRVYIGLTLCFRYQALAAESADFLSKLDTAVECCGEYNQLAENVDRTLSDIELVVDQCTADGVADTDPGLQHQLGLVTAAASRVAAFGKVLPCFQRYVPVHPYPFP